MKIVDRIMDKLTGGLAGVQVGARAIEGFVDQAEEDRIRLQESALDAELSLARDDAGWIALSEDGTTSSINISRTALMRAVNLSRIMYVLNPLIKRAVTVQELYVWGSGCEIKAEDETVKEVLKDFFSDPKNQAVIGQAWPEREREQRIEGNTFFVFYLNKRNGTCRIRTFQVDQIVDVICNPDDAKEPWFYKRLIKDDQYELYPDLNFSPKGRPSLGDENEGVPIRWDVKVLHVKSGGLSGMKFGMPELRCVLPWATAYKKFLEQFATIMQAYARIAMKMTGMKTPAGAAAAKSKLNTAVTSGSSTRDTNPPPNTASWMALPSNIDVSSVKTAGSTTGPDEARALRSMVAAGTDTPEHFFGDSDIGNFATSSTLDRPTELKMVARQNMWKFVILTICRFLIQWSALAPLGKLRGAGFAAEVTSDPFDGTNTVTVTPPKDKTAHVAAIFPTILERDVVDRVRAVVQAATLGGSPAEGIIPERGLLFKMLMTALGEKDAEFLTNKFYPKEVFQGFVDPADKAENEKLDAQGKADLGKAALKQADASMKKANQPPPKPVAASSNGN